MELRPGMIEFASGGYSRLGRRMAATMKAMYEGDATTGQELKKLTWRSAHREIVAGKRIVRKPDAIDRARALKLQRDNATAREAYLRKAVLGL